MRQKIRSRFSDSEDEFGSLSSSVPGDDESRPVFSVLAVMNAFNPEEVARVVSSAQAAGLISPADDSDRILYLTGAVRQQGLETARTTRMRKTCEGHRTC